MNVNRFEHIHFQNQFTDGQGKAMQFVVTPSEDAVNAMDYTVFETDVQSLYEPYYAQLAAGPIISVDDDAEDGGATVCRETIWRLKFQMGFDYEFQGTVPDEIFVDTNTLFTYDDTPDHTINLRILQLGPGFGTTSPISVLQQMCHFEPWVSGTVYSMEVLGSMNITARYLNEIQVKDPQLYEELMEQYYHIMIKITASGIVKQSTFYKP